MSLGEDHTDGTKVGSFTPQACVASNDLALGLPPLSQYDAAARPMYESFPDTPDLAPYTHVPAAIDLLAKNTKMAYGADRSEKRDFSDYDRVNDWELNEILWRAVKGPDAPLPPTVRQAIACRSAP